MTASRVASDPLSETTKTALRELWIKEVFNREKYDKDNKYTNKGIQCEPDAMDLLLKVTNKTHFKNRETFGNEFITGTPDIITKNGDALHIIDVKCSWDIWTYNAVTDKSAYKSYFYQQLGYMWLVGASTAELDYCLVNTPEDIMTNELYKLSFKFPELTGSDEKLIAPFKRNYIFDDIEPKFRVKKFDLAFDGEEVEKLKEKIGHARNYMSTLSL